MRLSTLFSLTLAIALAIPVSAQQGATGAAPVLTATPSADRAGGPVNDRYDQATPIVPGVTTYTGSNAGAAVEMDLTNPTASCQTQDGGNSVYWAIRPVGSGTVTIDLSGSGFDTVVTLLDGFNFAEIGCDDDGGEGTRSLLTAPVTSDFVYVIRVTGYQGASGDITMNVSAADGSALTQPASDPGALFGLPLTQYGSYVESTVGATAEDGELPTSCQANDGGKSIWRRFTAATTGVVTFDLRGSSFDTVIGVYDFVAFGTLPTTEIACDDDGIAGDGDLTSILSFDVVAGEEYAVRISGFQNQEGTVQMSYTEGPLVAAEETPEGTVSLTVAPNPVTSASRVTLDIPTAQTVAVDVFDMTGRRVATLHDGAASAGPLALTLDASALPSGVYVVRAVGETVSLTERLTVVR